MSDLAIRRLDAAGLDAVMPALATILHDCVHAGASVGWILPFERAEAEAWWRERIRPAVASGAVALLVAEAAGAPVGTVQLGLDTPRNQPHRAEVRKLLVAPAARRRGVARRLMAAVEPEARAAGRSLLTLDTRTGDAAEPLYRALGFETVGVQPFWCLDPIDGRTLDSTTFMWRRLEG